MTLSVALFAVTLCFVPSAALPQSSLAPDAELTREVESPNTEQVAAPRLVNPCLPGGPAASLPWCDASLPIDQRVDDMISRMHLHEKIGALDTETPAIDSLHLPAYNWWSEATHGISHVNNDNAHQYESNMAFPITTAMSFNRSLWAATGSQIGQEARAFMNGGLAFSTYWAPVINLAREPRWGRNIETPGEDPYLTGEYATAFVTGFEHNEADPYHLQASACCKHYAANSMESSTVAGATWDRHDFDANVTMQDLVDSYLLPFQACVEKGKVSGLMCSYNAINGKPSCANDWLLQTVARDSWNFDGYITSDCDADSDVFNRHHYTKTPEEAVADVLHAGTDVDCTAFVGKYANSALNQSLITKEDIEERLKKLFRVRMRLSHFDPTGPLDKIPASVVCSDDGKAVARDGVTQSVTMLKNMNNALPLTAGGKTFAVIGPNSNLSKAVAGYYGGNSCDGKYNTMVDAISQYGQTVTTMGVPDVHSSNTSGVAAAAMMASNVDHVIMALGTDLTCAREGSDSTSISLSAGQAQLVKDVAAAAKAPVTVVILSAVPLDLTELLMDDNVGAILYAGQPSVQTLGIGDLIFGKSSPAGRMVQTLYPAAYADQISIFDFNMRPGPSAWPRPDCDPKLWASSSCPLGTNPGRTHRFYTGVPVVKFGFGLSYTTFSYQVVESPAQVDLAPLRRVLAASASKSEAGRHFVPRDMLTSTEAGVQFSVNVTNTGDVDADDVVLGFIVPPGAGVDGVPLQTLFGFERIHLAAGQSMTVWIAPELTHFALADSDGVLRAQPGDYKVHFGIADTAQHGMGYAETTFTAA